MNNFIRMDQKNLTGVRGWLLLFEWLIGHSLGGAAVYRVLKRKTLEHELCSYAALKGLK